MQALQVTVIGGGLAGTECALTLAERGVSVRLLEQKPLGRTPAQSGDGLAELVCSNSLRGAALENAVGLLKEEMRRLGSFVLRAADRTRVPAGGALAVDRHRFSGLLTRWVDEHPRIERVAAIVERLPEERPLVVATGPLTAGALAADLERRAGAPLAYYDAIAPIVTAESLDMTRLFAASRYDKGETADDQRAYLNSPLDEEGYHAFVEAVRTARRVEEKPFEQLRYFEGCLPLEVMAERGPLTLAFGPMKPVGLVDPRTGRRPFAVVQLRQEDAAATAYNLVGFQTRLSWPEQERIFRTLPGLEAAEFERFGAIHRNTFVDAPRALDGALGLRSEPGVLLAGQITGTEGYVESAAVGWLAAFVLLERAAGRAPRLPPPSTAHGGLLAHLAREVDDFQPSNITFSLIAPWEGPRLGKRERQRAIAERALADLDAWRREVGV